MERTHYRYESAEGSQEETERISGLVCGGSDTPIYDASGARSAAVLPID